MKTTLYYDIIDAFVGDVCPVCKLLHDRIVSAVDMFLYEKVNNGHIRSDIRDSHGFCENHAKLMMKMGDPLSHAQIYADLVTDLKKSFETDIEYKSNISDCYFCTEQNRFEDDICESFAVSLIEEDFCEKLKSSATYLCNNHFLKISKYCDKTKSSFSKRILIDFQKNAVSDILSGLEEIKLKHDYRYTGEPISREGKISWRKAVNLIGGYSVLDLPVKRR